MKKGINYLLVNSTFLIFIVFILNKLDVLNNIIDTLLLIFLSLILSYIIYPIYKAINRKINNILSIVITYTLLLLFIFIVVYSIIPKTNFINKVIDLFSNILKFENIIKDKYNINLDIDIYLETIINYILNNSLFLIKNIFKYLSKLLFIVILSICILININYIKLLIEKIKYKELIYNINNKLNNYLISSLKVIIIQFIEYTFIFLIIGHPNYLLLGILNSLNTFIPFLGSIITNIIAITTSSVISKKLLILTSIVSILLPQIDCYIITPKIYSKDNRIPETLYIITMIILGSLFNFYGIILSLPILIIVIEILKYKNIVKNI